MGPFGSLPTAWHAPKIGNDDPVHDAEMKRNAMPKSSATLVLFALLAMERPLLAEAAASAASAASAAASQARETVARAPDSPYRLARASDRVAVMPAAPYLADPRYRLANAAAVTEGAPPARGDLSTRPYARQIDSAARAAGVDPALVHALVKAESAYRADALSPKGAVGLMQILPQTAAQYGVADPSAVGDNLRAGTRHLRRLIDKYDARLELVLAAYNAGEGAVARYGDSIPPYAETRLYVPAVIAHYRANGAREPGKPAPQAKIDYLPGARLDARAVAQLR